MKLLRVMLPVLLFSLVAFSQEAAPKFVSVYGGFQIALPGNPGLSRGVRNAEPPDRGAGAIAAWDYRGVVFTILYLDPLDDREFTAAMASDAIAENDRRVRDIVKEYGGTVEIESEFEAEGGGGLRGRQFVARIGQGKMITRNLQVGRRSYSLQAVVRDPKNVPDAFEVLRSFRLVDGRAIIRARFDGLAPVSLSRRRMPKAPKTDLELAGVKGAVSAIVEETEDLTGGAAQQGRLLSAEYYYDAAGLLVRENSCDANGLPQRVSVYGVVNGRLAVRSGTTEGRAKKPFDFTIVNSYDSAGRLAETKYFDPAGKIATRTTNEYAANSASILYFNAESVLRLRVDNKLATDGNVVEATSKAPGPNPEQSVVRYRYDAFDPAGNWTRRTTLAVAEKEGKISEIPVSTTYRTIRYLR